MFNNEMNTKVGVIGDKDVISAFKSVGFDVFHATTGDEVRELYKELVRKEYAVLYITEELAIKAPDIIKKAKAKEYPIITPIPSGGKSLGVGMYGIKKDVEKAIGVDILFNK